MHLEDVFHKICISKNMHFAKVCILTCLPWNMCTLKICFLRKISTLIIETCQLENIPKIWRMKKCATRYHQIIKKVQVRTLNRCTSKNVPFEKIHLKKCTQWKDAPQKWALWKDAPQKMCPLKRCTSKNEPGLRKSGCKMFCQPNPGR